MAASCTFLTLLVLAVSFVFLEEFIMLEGYKTIQEVAKEWEITPRQVQSLCASGKIAGASKFGNVWAIPEDAEKPKDGRVTTGQYKNWRKK